VVELANFVSGPLATMMLADLGADVIKVEPPRGDPFRRFGRPTTDMSAVFANVNHGKRSVTLDLKGSEDRQVLRTLLRTADVMVCNWRPSVADRLGLPDATLEADNPRLIRAYVTGYGADGPEADQPTFDTIIQARLGYGEVQGEAARPRMATTWVVDKATAAMVGQAVLAALVGRQRTGRGERIDVAMLDAGAYMDFPDGLANRTFLDHQPPDARNGHTAAIRPLAASDGWLVVVPVSADQIRRAFAAVGRPNGAAEVLAQADGAAMATRLCDRLEEATRTETVASLLAHFSANDVPAAPCLRIDEHLEDPQVEHNEVYYVAPWPGLGRVRQVRYPAVFSTWGKVSARGPAPVPGQHTGEIIRHL
jgi:crotonobetainyl-CoA:carnitine CoA-transferase CaiB-like acyl-CoA transferase